MSMTLPNLKLVSEQTNPPQVVIEGPAYGPLLVHSPLLSEVPKPIRAGGALHLDVDGVLARSLPKVVETVQKSGKIRL